MKTKKTKSKIQYGKKDLLDETFLDPKNEKHRITIWIDGDVLQAIKELAHASGGKYQPLINTILREHVFESEDLKKRVEKIERKLRALTG